MWKLDWLSVTLYGVDVSSVFEAFGFDAWHDAVSRGRFGFEHLVAGSGWLVLWGGNGGGVHVSLSGDGMCYYSCIENLFRSCDRFRVTRFDLALDVRREWREFLEYYRGGNVVTRLQRVTLVQDLSSDGGGTLYFGAPSSDVRVRIYDKMAESSRQGETWDPWGGLGPWSRIEFQFRGDRADALWRRGEVVLGEILDFRQPDSSDSNVSRWDILSWWLPYRTFRLSSYSSPVPVAPAERLAKIRAWLDRCVPSALVVLALLGGADSVHDLVDEWLNRDLSPRHAALLWELFGLAAVPGEGAREGPPGTAAIV